MLKLIIGIGGLAVYTLAVILGGVCLGVLVREALQLLGLATEGGKLLGALTIVVFWIGAAYMSVTWFFESNHK